MFTRAYSLRFGRRHTDVASIACSQIIWYTERLNFMSLTFMDALDYIIKYYAISLFYYYNNASNAKQH